MTDRTVALTPLYSVVKSVALRTQKITYDTETEVTKLDGKKILTEDELTDIPVGSQVGRFRGYLHLIEDLLNIDTPVNGDYAYIAEDLHVYCFNDSAWYKSEQTIPDQIVDTSTTVPLSSSSTGNIGISTKYARSDHVHPIPHVLKFIKTELFHNIADPPAVVTEINLNKSIRVFDDSYIYYETNSGLMKRDVFSANPVSVISNDFTSSCVNPGTFILNELKYYYAFYNNQIQYYIGTLDAKYTYTDSDIADCSYISVCIWYADYLSKPRVVLLIKNGLYTKIRYVTAWHEDNTIDTSDNLPYNASKMTGILANVKTKSISIYHHTMNPELIKTCPIVIYSNDAKLMFIGTNNAALSFAKAIEDILSNTEYYDNDPAYNKLLFGVKMTDREYDYVYTVEDKTMHPLIQN
jgi:hypothetical protein